MKINYYDSVKVSGLQLKEQSLSITDTLYNWGAKLSEKSGMYKGNAYTLIYNATTKEVTSQTHAKTHEKFNFIDKLCALAGRCLKAIAAYFNAELHARHILAKMDSSYSVDNLVAECAFEARWGIFPKNSKGEGYGNIDTGGYKGAFESETKDTDCANATAECFKILFAS